MVFGKTDSALVDLDNLMQGFRIDGAEAGDRSGFSVAGAGDVNGDGLADLIVGAGTSYVVFGKGGRRAVNLADLGGGGFHLDDPSSSAGFVARVSAAGDVDGDGLADLIVGAPSANSYAGASYVVFSEQLASPAATYRARG